MYHQGMGTSPSPLCQPRMHASAPGLLSWHALALPAPALPAPPALLLSRWLQNCCAVRTALYCCQLVLCRSSAHALTLSKAAGPPVMLLLQSLQLFSVIQCTVGRAPRAKGQEGLMHCQSALQ